MEKQVDIRIYDPLIGMGIGLVAGYLLGRPFQGALMGMIAGLYMAHKKIKKLTDEF